MWQVSGNRRWHSFDEYARLDLYYVDNWSIWTDLAILAKTVPAVLSNRPAK
jgi:lipopolysaccharide/colanic/teichoic acid biosynthesis glycosyltransferase